MVSLIAAASSSSSSAYFMVSHQPLLNLSSTRLFPIVLVITPPKRQHLLGSKRKELKQKSQNQFLLEVSDTCGCGVVRMCKRWEGEGDQALEMEVLEFMKNSKNPEKFPTKKELFEGGRGDLVEAIVKRGGWMSIGWEDESEREEFDNVLSGNWDSSLEKYGQNGFTGEGRSGSELCESKHLEGVSFLGNSSSAASSSGRSPDMAAEDDGGIEGILNRLEKQRSLSFGLKISKNGSMNHLAGNLGEDEHSAAMSKDVASGRPERSKSAALGLNGRLFSDNGSNRLYSNVPSSLHKVDTWRSWSIQRAGFSDAEFEAGEIDFGGNTNGRTVDASKGEIITVASVVTEPLDKTKGLNPGFEGIEQSDVKTRLQRLELELSSTLRLLRASTTTDLPDKATEHLSEDLRQLSDASEFQENEIMNGQDKLRSIRAKLAILEGRMTLAIIDAQKILDEKQKRIDDARRALHLLRTTCIVWPNSGTEVLLAGSFDGWATKRKMERSSTGIFSLCLKLYPGRYEIKFIVDGSWRVDPLRPVVNNNGFENNLLIIT